jgi:hypothetical protein
VTPDRKKRPRMTRSPQFTYNTLFKKRRAFCPTLPTFNHRLFYRELGSGPLLILLSRQHGFSTCLLGELEHFAARGFMPPPSISRAADSLIDFRLDDGLGGAGRARCPGAGSAPGRAKPPAGWLQRRGCGRPAGRAGGARPRPRVIADSCTAGLT